MPQREGTIMPLHRRHLAQLGAAALLIAHPALAQSGEEAKVAQAVDTLNSAMVSGDRKVLEDLSAPQLSYGHSSARIENRQEFVDAIMNRKAKVKFINLTDQTISFADGAAIVRHTYNSESELEGQVTKTRIGVLQVWQNQAGQWKLLARQAYRL
jgi:myo-inositol-hexaphosphate 3-phosphohydrolase